MRSSAAESSRRRPPLRLAFLGCGAITERHARTLARLAPEVRRCFASRLPERAAAFNRRLRGDGWYGSYAAAWQDSAVDVVLVATPPMLHLELTLAALEAGKDVIVEKPAFLRSSDFGPVREAELRSGRRVFVAENYCYKPLAHVLRGLVTSGILGELRFVQLNAIKSRPATDWRGDAAVCGGGALFEGGVHWLDLLANLGLHVEAVQGYWPGDREGLESSMLVVVQFEEGAVGTLYHAWDVRSPLRGLRLSRIYGTEGAVTFESNGLFVLVTGRRPRLVLPGLRDLAGYGAMFRDFLDAIRTGREPIMTLDRARRGLDLVEAAYRTAGCARPEAAR